MAATRLDVRTDTGTEPSVLKLSGELDASTADLLVQALEEPDVRSGPLLLDLSDVTFLDSAGLGVMIEGHRTWRDAGHTFALQGVPDRVVSVITYAGLADHFEMLP